MIQETQVLLRKQTPTAPNEWLYQSTFETRSRDITHEDGTTETLTEEVEVRNFVKSVYLGSNAEPWAECTDEEKTAWESRTLDTEEGDAADTTTDTTEEVAEEGLGV